jgi:hypothetical protein
MKCYEDYVAGAISRFLDIERKKPEFNGVKCLAGMLMVHIEFQRTALPLDPPREFIDVQDAACACMRATSGA